MTTGQYMIGQIYVEQLLPHEVKHQYPLVFIAGQAQTGTVSLLSPTSVVREMAIDKDPRRIG